MGDARLGVGVACQGPGLGELTRYLLMVLTAPFYQGQAHSYLEKN